MPIWLMRIPRHHHHAQRGRRRGHDLDGRVVDRKKVRMRRRENTIAAEKKRPTRWRETVTRRLIARVCVGATDISWLLTKHTIALCCIVGYHVDHCTRWWCLSPGTSSRMDAAADDADDDHTTKPTNAASCMACCTKLLISMIRMKKEAQPFRPFSLSSTVQLNNC